MSIIGHGSKRPEDSKRFKDEESVVGDLMHAFQDVPHSNPLLNKQALAALEKSRADKINRQSMGRRNHVQQLEGQASAGQPAGAWGLDTPWNGHNDKCSEDTPNCNKLASQSANSPGKGVNVYDWPWKQGVGAKAKQAAVLLAQDASMLQQLSRSGVSGANIEEKLSQSLQAGSFDLEKLATLQRLADAGNSTNSTESQPRLSIFNKWYWTPDNTEYLEKQHGIAVDQWPWEACKGIDCKPGAIFAKGTREWERGVAQKLRADSQDMSKLADADAQLGIFHTQSLNQTESNPVTCASDVPGCKKLGELGVQVNHWPWQEARAKRQWEQRLAGNLVAEATALNRQYEAMKIARARYAAMMQERAMARQGYPAGRVRWEAPSFPPFFRAH
ncbi:hypothetical protein GUITHDRAFT_164256 [Guillardia theta CCMP2712]|uniref:Uncharacterized protein n=1 Tax=Guillardia theta (strain CCMP2712) TaxID=905079 RepID=L1J043_GUITC|nr:hypothetical protein GUITHDRAFT_164256 [Guillardia theta CCMP2712]EKX41888.1 hypothetical protein GUITHDRAFT_164256 [Guillardia theta CCMP2712]|eukprot:XP_005828868.1 hypothetical protein GUITHDRAFT_164256 [Guillardia theta CCMP2712]